MRKMRGFGWVVAAMAGWAASAGAVSDAISLAGEWRFALDRADEGVTKEWFSRALDQRVALPGTLPGQGIGDDVTVETKWTGGIVDQSFFNAPEYAPYRKPGNVKVPFWLQPEKYYVGAAWYQRDIEIPAGWKDRRVELSLERSHWETRVWIDGRAVGTNNSLATPHDYDLGSLAPGKHTLSIRVDNRMVVDVGENSHSVSDHTQGNWNGIVGRIELRATAALWLDDVQTYPDVTARIVRVVAKVRNTAGGSGEGRFLVSGVCSLNGRATPLPERNFHAEWSSQGAYADMQYELPPSTPVWDEFSPAVLHLTVALTYGGVTQDVRRVTTGLRAISARGTQFTINDRPMFVRGTLDCCIFPKTGHPPTDVAEWKRIIGVAKAHGLNLIRFHSWCPPEAAFEAADELGFYFHVEASSWANQSASLGDGKPLDQWIYDETDRILKYYGNHPSFILMPYGNEPGGKHHKEWLAKWVTHYREKDPRRLWSSGAGWPEIPENQWHCVPGPRIQAWGGGLKSIINAQPPQTTFDFRDYIQKRGVPVVSHEIGQWCVYPNLDEMKKYTGYLKPRNFEIFRDRLAEHHLLGQAHDFLLASGKLQALCYKADIEAALRTPGMAGFELLDLHDFPGQGTALVGVLDPFWEEKGYITPAEYRRFCNATVPLARLAKRVFTSDETLTAGIEVAHFGSAPLRQARIDWSVSSDAGEVVAHGQLSPQDIALGNGIALGNASVALGKFPAPARCKLSVKLGETSPLSPDGFRGNAVENDWDFWVYPARVETPPAPAVKIADELNADTLAILQGGGKVLLMVPPQRVKNAAKDKVVMGFSSIFWNTAWTHRQPPTTLGILCDPKHPALASFPTEFHSNWQWWYVIQHAAPMILDELPSELKPTVQVIDDWFTARKLGLVFEAKVGAGKLLVTSIDLSGDLASDPVRRQMRHSLLTYSASDAFKPGIEVAPEKIRQLMSEPPASGLAQRGAKVAKCDSEAPGYAGTKAIDGDPDTIWHTAWEPAPAPMPHEIVIDLGRSMALGGITCLPRQDMANGRIGGFEVFAAEQSETWGAPLAAGEWSNDAARKDVRFQAPVTARFVRLVAKSEVGGNAFAAVAELDVIPSDR